MRLMLHSREVTSLLDAPAIVGYVAQNSFGLVHDLIFAWR